MDFWAKDFLDVNAWYRKFWLYFMHWQRYVSGEIYLIIMSWKKLNSLIICLGISLKTQELYAVVFLARYLDLFSDFISLYNTVMKLVFIGSSLAIVWCMRYHRAVKRSYDRELDTFRHFLLILASFVLALVCHEKFTLQEVSFSYVWLYYCLFIYFFGLKFLDWSHICTKFLVY